MTERKGQVVGRCDYCQTLQLDSDRRCHSCGAPLRMGNDAYEMEWQSANAKAALQTEQWGYVRGKALVSWRI